MVSTHDFGSQGLVGRDVQLAFVVDEPVLDLPLTQTVSESTRALGFEGLETLDYVVVTI